MEETNCNQKWLFTEEELQNTPSVRAGVTLEQELTFRQKQAMLIQTIGLKSGLTQLAVNTSVIFMHRFFMYRTVKTFPRIHLALGFAFAGGKVEESARKLEQIIRTAVEVIRHNRNKEFLDKSDPLTYEMDSQWRAKLQVLFDNNCNIESPAYLEMRKLVLECETEIYGVIGFQLQIVHPHNYVIRMCALLGAENIKDISQYAYNLATASSQLTMLCLKYKPETIATMCLNIASKAHSFEPMKDSNVKWYQVLVPNTDFAEIEAVSEEFLHLIKGCPLLPSWMTNLARMSRVNNNNRAMPGPSRGPGASSVSAPPGGRQNPPAISSTTAPTASGNVPPTSSTASLPQNYPARSQVTATSLSSSQVTDSRQLISNRAAASQLLGEAVISPGSKHLSAETGVSGLVSAASDAHVKDSVPSSHSRLHPSSSSAQVRSHHPSSALPPGALPHQPHRAHPGNGRPANQTVAPAGSTSSNRPPTKPSVPLNPQGVRPTQLPGQPGHHPAAHQSLPRPTHDQVRHQDAGHTRDQSRAYSDVSKGQRDHARSRDSSRPHESLRSHDPARHGHPEHRPDLGGDAKHIPHSDSSLNRSQSSRSEHTSQRPSTVSPNTPPTNTPTVKSSPPEPPTDASQLLSSSGDTQDTSINVTTNSPENPLKLQSNLDQQSAASHAPKLSLRMYRERTKSKTPAEQTTAGDIANAVASITDDSYTLGVNSESATNSPADVSLRLGSGDLANFHKPQDSPSNPRIKIKVKRDPSSGERHAVKYAETGLKIKIKPIRSDTASSAESGDAGPSGVGMASSASTPMEEGEIVEDTPPSSGDSEQKSERLKIRLSVPKSDHGSGYSRRESDQGSNGHSGEHEQGHRSHHHSHHRSHHHSKSKKHSKHDRSRHEVKTSSKRSASALDYYDERPSKTSRSETHSASTGLVSHHSGHADTSARSHQQNTGFSIHDAFSSTMPHNIFDDDDDPAHAHPPVTPTVESVPAHHERFHQLMAQHRAREAVRKPPLPKGPPPPQSSPPPPPPPTTM